MSEKREWWIESRGVNFCVLVDGEDYSFLSRFTWHIQNNRQTNYAHTQCKIGGKQHSVSMHRLICGLVNSMIDHKNRNGLDNRKSNLRFCTPKQNSMNRVRKNKYGYRGVYKPKNGNFAIQIRGNNKKFAEYGFKTAEDAARRYDQLSKEIHGEFGIRNFED